MQPTGETFPSNAPDANRTPVGGSYVVRFVYVMIGNQGETQIWSILVEG